MAALNVEGVVLANFYWSHPVRKHSREAERMKRTELWEKTWTPEVPAVLSSFSHHFAVKVIRGVDKDWWTEMEDAQNPISLTLIFIWVWVLTVEERKGGGGGEGGDGWMDWSPLSTVGHAQALKNTLFICLLL